MAPTRDDARAHAHQMFGRGERIEVGTLADAVGVNRVTVYRWLGSRETLLAELLWERLEQALLRADAQAHDADATGTERLVTLLLGIFPRPGSTSPTRGFITREPALAMRLMTTGVVHDRLTAWVADVIEAERDAGRITPVHPARQLAEIMVRSGEAVFWFDVASSRGIDRDNVAVIVAALCPPS